jgi:hypothetical protein
MKIPKIEGLIIFAFLICVALWAVSKCSARRAEIGKKLQEFSDEREERPVRRDTIYVAQPAAPATYDAAPPAPRPKEPVSTTAPRPAAPVTVPPVSRGNTPAPAPAKTATTAPTAKYATLYVTIDGLNLRKDPGLKAETIEQLELYQAVLFLNQKSEKPEEINLGTEKVTDHWVKVRTQAGKEGWVFGAGVHYYKTKRKE